DVILLCRELLSGLSALRLRLDDGRLPIVGAQQGGTAVSPAAIAAVARIKLCGDRLNQKKHAPHKQQGKNHGTLHFRPPTRLDGGRRKAATFEAGKSRIPEHFDYMPDEAVVTRGHSTWRWRSSDNGPSGPN